MRGKRAEEAFDELQEGIERIRRMAQRITEAHDLVAANNRLLLRDREMMRAGPLRDARDLRPHERQLETSGRLASPRRSRRRRP